jgi:drug/metabolite transporter (DMT)-like permease
VIVVPLALLSALLYALGTVLQQKADMEEADAAGPRGGALVRVLRRPLWLLGVGAVLLGAGAQAAALGFGRLIIVQPLQVTSIVFALPLGVYFTAQRVGRREIFGALAVVAGLAAFVAISDPAGGKDDAPVHDWLIAGAIIAPVVVGVAAASLFVHRPATKAALAGTASGILFGLAAALTKATVDRLDDGIGALLGDWHVYALVAVAIPAFWLTQVALQTGALAPAIATTMAFDPVASLLLGMLLLDEQLHESAWVAAVSVAMLLVALGGLILLARAKREAEPPRLTALARAH